MKKVIVDPTVPYSYSQMMRDILALKSKYPKLISVKNAGFSVEGRQIPVVTLGRGNSKVFFCGSHHAREYISSAYLMYMVNVYADAANCKKKLGEYDLHKLLSKCTAYVMPMVNPDGVMLVQGGIKAVQNADNVESMKMIHPLYEEWKANLNGIDLNRQYPALWDQKKVVVNEPASELYNGETAATEPEVCVVMRICKNYNFKAAVSFHTKGEVIYYADANTHDKIPHAKSCADRLAAISGYSLMPVSEDPSIYAAGFENWFRQEFLRPGLLVELTPSTEDAMPHNDKQFFTLVWKKAQYLCAEMIRFCVG